MNKVFKTNFQREAAVDKTRSLNFTVDLPSPEGKEYSHILRLSYEL